MTNAQYWSEISLGLATLSVILVLLVIVCTMIVDEVRNKLNK